MSEKNSRRYSVSLRTTYVHGSSRFFDILIAANPLFTTNCLMTMTADKTHFNEYLKKQEFLYPKIKLTSQINRYTR